jgi:hypothetical protein
MKENYRGYYIDSTAIRDPDAGNWRPRVAIRWEEQFRIQQVVFEPARFARPFTTDKQAEQYGHAVIRKWVAAGRPNIAPSALL